MTDESEYDDLIAELLDKILEGLQVRLWFESWSEYEWDGAGSA